MKKSEIFQLFREIWTRVDQASYDAEILEAFSYMPKEKLISFMKDMVSNGLDANNDAEDLINKITSM